MVIGENSKEKNLETIASRSKRVESVAFYATNRVNAMSVLRMTGPAKAAGVEVLFGHEEQEGAEGAPIGAGDLIVIQREFSQDYELYGKIVQLAQTQKKPIVLDLDDLLLELPEDHPDRLSGYFSDALLPLLQMVMEADLITVATEPLCDYLVRYNPAVRVIPNYLDDSLWQLNPPRMPRKPGDPVTIGYMGGHSHEPDLKMVLPALLQLLEKYPGKIQFHFWGIQPPTELMPYSMVDWCPPQSYAYSDFAAYFQTQTADIMIAPLCDNLFNRGKSAIKFFEYSAMGTPGVYSRLEPYAAVVEDGMDGLLATTPDEWVAGISHLIDSPEYGSVLLENAQKKIRDHWLLSQHASEQFEIYREAIAQYSVRKKTFPEFYPLIRSITAQAFEKNRRSDVILQALKKQINELKAQLQIKQNNPDSSPDSAQNFAIQINALVRELAEAKLHAANLDQLITEKDQAIGRLGGELDAKTAYIGNLEDQLRLQNISIAEFREQLSDRSERIRALEAEGSEQREKIAEMQASSAQLEDEVLKYASSRSWRWTRPFRRLLSKLRR